MRPGVAVDADRIGGDPRGDAADGFGGFGGVLGQIGDDLAVGDLPAGPGADGLDVQLRAPLDQPTPWMVGMRDGGESGTSHSAAQCVLELTGGQVGGRAATIRVVEPDERVEVHEAAGLELGDLPEARLDPMRCGEPVEFAVECLGGAPPQLSGMNVPHHRTRAVEPTATQPLIACRAVVPYNACT